MYNVITNTVVFNTGRLSSVWYTMPRVFLYTQIQVIIQSVQCITWSLTQLSSIQGASAVYGIRCQEYSYIHRLFTVSEGFRSIKNTKIKTWVCFRSKRSTAKNYGTTNNLNKNITDMLRTETVSGPRYTVYRLKWADDMKCVGWWFCVGESLSKFIIPRIS